MLQTKNRRLTEYLFRYKLRLVYLVGLVFGTTILGGASISLVVPLVDHVLIKSNTSSLVALDQKEPFFHSGWMYEQEMGLRTYISDMLSLKTSWELLQLVALFLVVLLAAKAIFMFAKEYVMEQVSHRIVRDLRNDLYQHVQTLSMDYFAQKHVGDLMSRITSDTALVHQAVAKGWVMLIFHIMHVLMYAGIAWSLNWKLSLIAFFLLPILVFPIVSLGRKVRKLSQKTQHQLGNISSILQETFLGIKVVKAFGMEQLEIDKFKSETQKFYRNTMKFVKRDAAVSPLMEVVAGVSAALFLLIGGKEVLEGSMTAGQFMLFIVAALSLLQPFKKIGKAYTMIQQAMASFDRLYDVFSIVPSIQDNADAQELKLFGHSIEYQNVAVSYDQENYVLKEASFSVKKGDLVAFVGASGSGKSSLMSLLLRFYDPVEGCIRVDQKPIQDWTISSLRSQIGLVTQEVILFHDTIYKNIAYGNPQATEEMVHKAAQMANAHDFIQKLPEQYQTMVGDQGARLSGGERQRIAIARALLKNPPILILDEATSSLDAQSEKYVQQAIDRLMEGRTVLAIAHRLSTIRHANLILVLDNGRIVQSGTHNELIQASGPYQKLYELQIK